ncbi:MAG TPA: SDR family NAD(P)-dependent oxidoreductase [Acidimicrobiia bacterium]|nr:SDR family NAD(P)-dependent oxidoreductase [Acidimicrobiia bacterium]
MEQLHGKVAVVTGAGSGIGRALAARLVAEGMRVVAADIEVDALAGTARHTDVASTFVTDVANAGDVDALAEHVYETFGGVDLLCNNAGVFAGGLIWERPASDFDWTLGVNLWGILHAVRAFVPRMIDARREAHIVNTVSMAGIVTMRYTGPYNVSKFAALAATESLAHDLAVVGAPIGVSAVVPSLVATRIAQSGRNRPGALAAPRSEDARFVEQALADSTASAGIDPTEVAALIVDAVRTNTYLVPTKPSYTMQVRDRAAALVDRRLPPMPEID